MSWKYAKNFELYGEAVVKDIINCASVDVVSIFLNSDAFLWGGGTGCLRTVLGSTVALFVTWVRFDFLQETTYSLADIIRTFAYI